MSRPKIPVDYPEEGPHFAVGQWKEYGRELGEYADGLEKQIARLEESARFSRVLSDDEL